MTQVFDAGDVVLQSGHVFPGMQLAYETYGTLNAARDNVVVYPTSFAAQHHDTEWLAAPGGILDTDRWFVVIPNLFGNGLSSSPSNSLDRFKLSDFPRISYHDAVSVQRRMLVEVFGIERVALVYGWSMGGMQAYQWAASFRSSVRRVAVVCGSARCSPYNFVFLEAVKAALMADPAYRDCAFRETPTAGLRAMGRIYAGWAMSHPYFRDELWREAGFKTLEAYLEGSWDRAFARRDANDLVAQIGIWQSGDISRTKHFAGDFVRAMGSITADVLLMPGATDRYFQAEDNEAEVPLLTSARSVTLRPIPSAHGHRAGNPHSIPADRDFLRAAIAEFMSS
jgi:homoserine O-acetyltransferase